MCSSSKTPIPSPRPRRKRAGFSILEALIAATVLGIGLIALVKLHQSAMRGMKSSREMGIAMDIAVQRAEELAAMPRTALPVCATVGGCKADANAFSTGFANPKPGCTNWATDGLMRDASGALPPTANTEANAASNAYTFRVDEVVRAHPDGTQHANASVVEVYVCWRDEQGFVRQVMTTRMAATGL